MKICRFPAVRTQQNENEKQNDVFHSHFYLEH